MTIIESVTSPGANPLDTPGEFYTSTDVRNVTGVSYRQLDYWTRAGFLGPDVEATPGSGRWRLYRFEAVVIIAALLAATQCGVEPSRVAQLVCSGVVGGDRRVEYRGANGAARVVIDLALIRKRIRDASLP